MSARATAQLSKVARKGRRGAPPGPAHDKGPEFGRQIFVYNHVYTNQVVYSLTRNLKNSHALKQLPYNGKKTVPAAIRKDLWEALATIEFPSSVPESPAYGLATFHKLREYRRLHETQWPKDFAWEVSKEKENEGEIVSLTRKERGRRLQDQKANSVADIAAALQRTTMRKLSEDEVSVERKARKAALAEKKAEAKAAGVKFEKKEEAPLKQWEPVVNATVKWKDILDAEYAASWPETVVHDKWIIGRAPSAKYMEVTELAPELVEGAEADGQLPPSVSKDKSGKAIL